MSQNNLVTAVNVNNTRKYISDAVNGNKDQLQWCLDELDKMNIPMENSISRGDVAFLMSVCLEEKPNAIMEIGTWVGRSAYTMAIASDADIYTCDFGNNMFVDIEGFSDRIHIHPNTHSTRFLKTAEYHRQIHRNTLPKFDMVFVDGYHNEAEDIFDACEDSFTLIAHDYFDMHTLEPCKGHTIILKLAEYAITHKHKYSIYPTSRNWIPKGYPVYDFGGVNACCGMIKVSKING